MKNVFIINAHEYYPYSEGKLNKELVDRIENHLVKKNYTIKHTTMQDDYNVEEELEKHLWADYIIIQSPVNWMGVPWSFKKYMDIVYTAGMRGQLCNGDGRSRENPTLNYGTGGLLKTTQYMLSLTFNAPKKAFNNKDDWFFEGKSVDDLFYPVHQNFKFFGAQPLETFCCFDVKKNPDIENDFLKLEHQLNATF